MSTTIELTAAAAAIAQAGQYGTKGIFPVDDDKIVASANMKAGAYTVAAQPKAPCLLSVTVTASGAADTMGTVTIAGTDADGAALTEEVTPVAGSTVYTENEFASVTSVTGAGWVISEGNDAIKVGVAGVLSGDGYYFCALQVLSAAAAASQANRAGAGCADFSAFTTIPAGTYPCRLTKIALNSGEAIGILAKA